MGGCMFMAKGPCGRTYEKLENSDYIHFFTIYASIYTINMPTRLTHPL
jgi:hypothetical protein